MGEIAESIVDDMVDRGGCFRVRGVDPRAKSADKLQAPDPLPYVSRRALARVKDRVDAPTSCPYCAGKVELVSNAEIYAGREYGDWPYAYLCKPCDAYVGLHTWTDIPLGTLADKATRAARKEAKSAFHMLVRKRFGGDRTKAYLWLSKRLDIQPSETHFGMFDRSQCGQAMKVLAEELTGPRKQ